MARSASLPIRTIRHSFRIVVFSITLLETRRENGRCRWAGWAQSQANWKERRAKTARNFSLTSGLAPSISPARKRRWNLKSMENATKWARVQDQHAVATAAEVEGAQVSGRRSVSRDIS